MNARLVVPDKIYEASWQKAVAEFRDDPKSIRQWEVLGDPKNLDACMRNSRDFSRGENLPSGWVPFDIFWLIDDAEIVGIVSIRRELNDDLRRRGGHIGYEIVPSRRGKGYGKKILELSLAKVKEIGIKKVLVTSFEKNIASRKVIEANGGRLENIIKVPGENDSTWRYWIEIQ